MRRWVSVSLLGLAISLTSCAAKLQPVAINSTPSLATVSVNGEAKGVTPVTIMLEDRGIHRVLVQKPGYEPYHHVVESHQDLEQLGPLPLTYQTRRLEGTINATLQPLRPKGGK